VSWTPAKLFYDGSLLCGVAAYLGAYLWLAPLLGGAPLDDQSLRMRAFGSAAFLLLTMALAIGPLARLDRRFLPLLYNRRHLGVVTCVLALAHAGEVLGWYFAFSPIPASITLLTADPGAVPFIAFGMLALGILILLASTEGGPMGSALRPLIGRRITLEGQVERLGRLLVFRAEPPA